MLVFEHVDRAIIVHGRIGRVMEAVADKSAVVMSRGLANMNVVKLVKGIFHLLQPDHRIFLQILPRSLALIGGRKLKPVFLFPERHRQNAVLLYNLGVVMLDECSKNVSLFAGSAVCLG